MPTEGPPDPPQRKRKAKPKPKEAVNHPSHYGGASNTHETIKCLRAWLTPEQYKGFLMGNAIKYLSRLGKKGEEAEDAAKAKWYANELENFCKEEANGA
jgi:hypothetical protein